MPGPFTVDGIKFPDLVVDLDGTRLLRRRIAEISALPGRVGWPWPILMPRLAMDFKLRLATFNYSATVGGHSGR